jgi:hypothetical protein
MWKAISPFIDPVTSQKICFVADDPKDIAAKMGDRFDMEELEMPLGGRNPVSYDHTLWGQRMRELEEKKRAEIRVEEARMAGGGKVAAGAEVAGAAAAVTAVAAGGFEETPYHSCEEHD